MSRQTTGLTELCDPAGLTLPPAGADPCADRLLQQRAPLHEASLECKDRAQVPRKREERDPVPSGTTEGQTVLQHPHRQAPGPLREVQVTKVAVSNDGCVPAADPCGGAKRLLPVTPTLGEGPEVALGSAPATPGTQSASLCWTCSTPGPSPLRCAGSSAACRSRPSPGMRVPRYRMLVPARRSPSSAASLRWPAGLPQWRRRGLP